MVALALTAAPGLAQEFPVRTFTEGDGLPSSWVADVAQDPSGRMWFATRAGIAVYDGRDWTTYSTDAGLVPRDRARIVLDERGIPWSLASPPGFDVARLVGERWVSLPRPALPESCIAGSLAVMRGAESEWLAVGSSCGLLLRRDGRWSRLGVEDGLPGASVRDVWWNAGEGKLYVGTESGLAIAIDDASRLVAPPFALPRAEVLGFAGDDCAGRSCTWLVGRDWLGRIEPDGFREIARGLDVASSSTFTRRAAAPDGNGGLFFSTGLALYHFHREDGLRVLDETNGLASTGALGLVLDREGNAWIAAKRGVSRIAGFGFATYRQAQGLLEDEVTAALELRDGRIALGHRDGLTLIGPGGMRHVVFDGPVPAEHGVGRVLDMAEGLDGTLWIAANLRGLGRYRNGRVDWTMSGEQSGVTSVLVDRDGKLWVASASHVLVDDGAGLREVPLELSRPSGIRRLDEGPSGAIYACTMGSGLCRLRNDDSESWYDPHDPEPNSVFSVLERADGSLWVGTAGGLFEAARGGMRRVTVPDIARPVYFMLVDGGDRTWFGTDNGVLRWDGTRLDRFTVEDGLAGRETNRAAGLIDSRGRVWIGTSGGVTIYRSELDRYVPVAPRVGILGLEASGEKVPLDGPARLASDHNDLLFAFRAISFASERAIRLQSRLEGYESDWSPEYASDDQLARYTNLPPGHYRFHVRAAGRAGVWSEPVSSPEIVIVQPVWARPWFWGLAALLVGVLGFAVHRHVYQTRYARRLESEVRQRVEELRGVEAELAKASRLQSLGLLAGGIAHDFNNLLTIVLGNLSLLTERADPTSRQWVTDAECAVKRARELTGQLLTFSRGGAPVRNPARIDDVIRDSASFVLRGSNVRCETELPADLHVVSIDAGQINQVLNNLLINAIQAMPRGGVVRIAGRNVDAVPGRSEAGPHVAIEVRDQGSGIALDDLPHVFDPYFSTKEGGSGLGLATAYSIAHRHDGLLTVDSEPGRGSTFTLYLPASRDELATPPIARPAERFHGTRVLVMDDDDDVREVLRRMLEVLQCRVSTAADGAEALFVYEQAMRQSGRFDVVILDLTVPGGMGGEETMRRLLAIDPEVRAIVASGYAHSPVMAEHRAHGFHAVIPKPFEMRTLAEALRRTVGARAVS
jgi:signal transduction histidine kinase/ligand-binding sensor domain-containing protein/ActR/RegA family two-component response regulator